MPETQSVHGRVQYDTVPCSYCGTEIVKGNAIPTHLDVHESKCGGANICDATHPYPEVKRILCEDCAESIFGYERSAKFNYKKYLPQGDKWEPEHIIGLIVSLSITIITITALLLA